jgi:hypothetical protein
MRDYPPKVKGARVSRIGVAGNAVKTLSIRQPTSTMVIDCGCERLFGSVPGIHNDIPKATRPGSVARPIPPKTQIHLTGASVDPHRLIARQRAG